MEERKQPQESVPNKATSEEVSKSGSQHPSASQKTSGNENENASTAISPAKSSSDTTTKQNITGSDFDGQASR